MIVNGSALLEACPIKDMLTSKQRLHGVSHGMSEAGYDIRIKQDITFALGPHGDMSVKIYNDSGTFDSLRLGRFTLASAMEEFDMPTNLVGIVHDKSTWARRGLSVFNTVIEPGWKGFLTLELVYHGQPALHIPAGSGIAQVVFHETAVQSRYSGKYQNQADRPVAAIYEKG